MTYYRIGCDVLGGHDDCWPEILGASGATAPSLDTVRAGKAVIKKGMTGESVKFVQGIVGVLGDGVFGPATETAVKAFQTKNLIAATGIVNQATMAALDIAGQTGGSGGITSFDFTTEDVPTPPPVVAPPTTTPTPAVPRTIAQVANAAAEAVSSKTATAPAAGSGWSASTIGLAVAGLGAVGFGLWAAFGRKRMSS